MDPSRPVFMVAGDAYQPRRALHPERLNQVAAMNEGIFHRWPLCKVRRRFCQAGAHRQGFIVG
jgi:hypothetical protein